MSCGQPHIGGTKFTQAMVDQRPKFERVVYSRKRKILRPDLRKKKVKFL